MLKAADRHPRWKSSVSASSTNWNVQLAACQNFQQSQNGRGYRAFTWALVRVLKSEKSRGQAYTDVVPMIRFLKHKESFNNLMISQHAVLCRAGSNVLYVTW